MELTIEKISPKKAKEILEGNTQNRKLRDHVVNQYARDMENGRWTESGDPIRINCDANLLLDGQHRLRAIVKSGKAQKLVIARGVSQITMLNIDTGSKRTFGDNLKILGYKNASSLAAAIKWGTLYESDDERLPYGHMASNAEMMDWFTANPFIEDHVNRIQSVKHGDVKGIKLALVMISYYAKREDFELFLHQLVKGEGLYEGDPAHTLRRFVENCKITDLRRPGKTMHAVTIKAWNAFILGEKVRILRFKNGGANAEEFPTILTEA